MSEQLCLSEKKRENQLSSYAPGSARARETARPALALLPFLHLEPNRLRYLAPESCESDGRSATTQCEWRMA